MLTITQREAPEFLMDALRAHQVPMLAASPGVGKSAITLQLAEQLNIKVIDIRLAQSDPTDLSGFPAINADRTRAGYVPMDTFPIEGDELPYRINKDGSQGAQYGGWLLFLDEFTSAPLSVQAAAYKLVLDRQVGRFNLHEKVAIVCAGNKDTDNAIVTRMSTAMQSRLIHLELAVDFDDWVHWANGAGIDHRILSFLHFRKDLLHSFDPKHSDKTFPCPRTWEFLSSLIEPWETVESRKLPLIAGTIGNGAAGEFLSHCRLFGQLPTFDEIMSNPSGYKLPDNPSAMYAICGMIGHNTTSKNALKVMTAIKRFDVEFEFIALGMAVKRDGALLGVKAIDDWLSTNAPVYMSA